MFGLFKSKPKETDFHATIKSAANKKVLVKKGENLLKAALEQGVPWPHDCRVGSCGTCRCTLVEGKIKPLSDFSYVLNGEELKSGMILACQTALKTDVVIDVKLDEEAHQAEVRSYCGKLIKTRKLTHDILELTLKCDADVPHNYMAGQYAELATPGVKRARSYSYAKAPEDELPGEYTFFVRLVPGGEHTEWLFGEDRTGCDVQVMGPFGSFYMREGEGPMLCVAGGSGLAPIKALLEHAANQQVRRDVLFLFGARTQKDLYCIEELEAVRARWNKDSKFSFVPVLSHEDEGSDWSGPRGFVTDYLRREYIDKGVNVSNYQGYLCGPPPMIDAAIPVMNQAGISNDRIFFDKFLDASTMPGHKNREYRGP
jgi:toluene methyl-monooxygenase electron transfer component